MSYRGPLAMSVVFLISFFSCLRGIEKDYKDGQKPIVGTVIEERYMGANLLKNPKWTGLVSYSNETVRLGDSKYIIKLKTDDDKILAISVIDKGDGKKEALETLIEKGSRISFPKGNLYKSGTGIGMSHKEDTSETSFHEDSQIGVKRAKNIKVLN